jgi:hypothetical protein
MPEGNGNNRFWIEVKCEHEVYDVEWGAMLLLINMLLKEHDGGKFSNVGAYLCEEEN